MAVSAESSVVILKIWAMKNSCNSLRETARSERIRYSLLSTERRLLPVYPHIILISEGGITYESVCDRNNDQAPA